jgi:hypothetical protein
MQSYASEPKEGQYWSDKDEKREERRIVPARSAEIAREKRVYDEHESLEDKELIRLAYCFDTQCVQK